MFCMRSELCQDQSTSETKVEYVMMTEGERDKNENGEKLADMSSRKGSARTSLRKQEAQVVHHAK